MRVEEGRVEEGPAGRAVEVVLPPAGRRGRPELDGTVASWFLRAPGQSPAWDCYTLSVIHLRPIEGVRPAVVEVSGATHEVLVVALNPAREPAPTDVGSWEFLFPVNVCQQIQLPGDDAAVELARLCARAVVLGVLPAEPALAGAVEPWRSSLVKTSAHLRGEDHAP